MGHFSCGTKNVAYSTLPQRPCKIEWSSSVGLRPESCLFRWTNHEKRKWHCHPILSCSNGSTCTLSARTAGHSVNFVGDFEMHAFKKTCAVFFQRYKIRLFFRQSEILLKNIIKFTESTERITWSVFASTSSYAKARTGQLYTALVCGHNPNPKLMPQQCSSIHLHAHQLWPVEDKSRIKDLVVCHGAHLTPPLVLSDFTEGATVIHRFLACLRSGSIYFNRKESTSCSVQWIQGKPYNQTWSFVHKF